jgi:hypothetical protein
VTSIDTEQAAPAAAASPGEHSQAAAQNWMIWLVSSLDQLENKRALNRQAPSPVRDIPAQ